MKLYVPNPQKWVDFFDRVSSGKASLNQSGGGRKSSIIPLDHNTITGVDKVYPVKAVLPVEQTTAQAKSELEREDINPAKVIDMVHSSTRKRRRGIKRKRISKKSRRGVKQQRGSGKKKKYRRRKVSRKGCKKLPVSRMKDIFEIS